MAMSNRNWPADMVIEILLKLPVKSLIRFKCVAKSWCSLFKTPSFVSQHLSLSKKNNYLLVDYHDPNNEALAMQLFDYQTLVPYHDMRQHLPNHFADKPSTFCVYDGLFCLCDRLNSRITLWNPATKEFRILPECDQNMPSKLFNCLHVLGFGLDPSSNVYKVIYIRTYAEEKMRGRHHAIYRMSTDSWRVLENEDVLLFKRFHICPNYTNTCVNGVYYWQAFDSLRSGLVDYKILAFHLDTEVFQLINSPISEQGKLLSLHDDRISIWDTECIEGSVRSGEIWVLNNEGHWTKLMKIDPLLKVERMFGFWKDNQVFVESDTAQLLLYDLGTEEFSDVGIKSSELGDIDVYTYEESLVAVSRE